MHYAIGFRFPNASPPSCVQISNQRLWNRRTVCHYLWSLSTSVCRKLYQHWDRHHAGTLINYSGNNKEFAVSGHISHIKLELFESCCIIFIFLLKFYTCQHLLIGLYTDQWHTIKSIVNGARKYNMFLICINVILFIAVSHRHFSFLNHSIDSPTF